MKPTRFNHVPRIVAAFAPAAVACLLFASAARAADPPKEDPAAKPAAAPTTRPAGPGFTLKYKPKVTDAPASRGWGAARTGSIDPPKLYVLSPADFIGTTTREQPTLYWYISKPTKRSVDIAITPVDDPSSKRPGLADPVLSLTLKGVEKAGLHALDLSQAKGPGGKPVALNKGVKYKWVVEMVSSEADGARNPFAECMLKRVDEPATVRGAPSGPDAAAAYAEAGVWYDALAALNKAIAEDAQNKPLRDARRELLKSQKLIEDDQGNIVAEPASRQ
jgi:hypothetical protein